MGSGNKRSRTRFNGWQIEHLEQVFTRTHYPDVNQTEQLSRETGIPVHKMQVRKLKVLFGYEIIFASGGAVSHLIQLS